jgi:pimeloyl-ACP methyl ester carboxylesterase
MRRMTISTLLAAALIASYSPTASQADATVQSVTFTVNNPLEPDSAYEIHGRMALPEGTCGGVLLLQHGLSYGAWGWDFPIEPETYSTMRSLADAGFASVTIDRLGYGESAHPNGHLLTVEGYADMTRQMMDQLRMGTYSADSTPAFGKVGLVGHSAGTEISETTAALFGADALIATAYHHFPSQRIVTDFFTGDFVRAAQDDYEEFGGDEAGRTEYMYHLPNADPAIVAKDNELRNLTPSGEVFTIGPQPSRYVMHRITAPTLLVLAEHDILFEVSFAELEEAMFASVEDMTTMIVPDAGHSFMLHENADDTNQRMIDWLEARPDAVPACV